MPGGVVRDRKKCHTTWALANSRADPDGRESIVEALKPVSLRGARFPSNRTELWLCAYCLAYSPGSPRESTLNADWTREPVVVPANRLSGSEVSENRRG